MSNDIADLHSNINAPGTRTAYCPGTDANRPINFYLSEIATLKSNLNDLEDEYTNLVDGGSTSNLLENIANSEVEEEILFEEHISRYTPYLSDTAIKAYFTRTDVTQAHLIQCFRDNAPVSDNVWNFIMNLTLSFQEDLESYQFPYSLSPRSIKQGQISLAKNELGYSITGKLNCLYAADSVVYLKDSIAALIAFNPQGDIDKQLIDLDLAFEDYESAADRLDNFPLNGEAQRLLYKNYKLMYINIMTHDSGKYMLFSDEEMFDDLMEIALDTTHPCFKDARGLISAVFHEHYQEEKLSPSEGGGGGRPSNQDSSNENNVSEQLTSSCKKK